MKRQAERSLEKPQGAKKRKFTQTQKPSEDDDRELSPVDSGFKELSVTTTSHQITIRKSSRIKKIKIDNQKLTPTEKILKQTLKAQNLVHPLESICDSMKKFNPKVLLCNFPIKSAKDQVELSKLLPNLPLVDEIEFQGVILHELKNLDVKKSKFYVRWIPINILDDEYVTDDNSLRKKVKIGEMNYRQRQIVSEKIFKGLLK